jgi:integrase
MAHTRKRRTGWQAIWNLPTGKRRTETRERWTKGEALAYANEQEHKAVRTPWADHSGMVPTFSEYAEATVKVRPVATSTLAKERSLWRRIETVFGDWPINSVAPSDMRAFVDGLVTDGLSPAYVRDVYGLVAMTFDYAVADEVIVQTPCVRVALPKRTSRVVAARPEDVAAVVDSIDRQFRALVSLLAGTGLRISEALALNVSDLVDIPRPMVKVTKAISDGEIGKPKTTAGVRDVTLPPWLRPILKTHVNERGLGPTDLLFPAPEGGLLDHRRFRSRFWNPACEAAGVEVTPHQLRHLQASLAIEAGRPLTEIAARLGHENARVTMSVYAHWLRDDDSGSADVIPDMTTTTRPG